MIVNKNFENFQQNNDLNINILSAFLSKVILFGFGFCVWLSNVSSLYNISSLLDVRLLLARLTIVLLYLCYA